MLTTSREKTPAAMGVPKRAANTALMPHMVAILRSFSSSFKSLPRTLPMLPPSCRAAPSRPEEPPTRWVRTVEMKISGPVTPVIFSLEEMESITMSVPLFFS